MDVCKTCRFLSQNPQSILETKYWAVSLQPNQAYLGQCFINLKEHKSGLVELADVEWLDFANVVKRLETAIKSAFQPDLFNWTCLMNHAFQSESASPHVH